MKHLIYITSIVLSLVSVSAYADTWVTRNQAGGTIVLTDRQCSAQYPSLKQMYTRGPDGTTIHGCWGYYDNYVHVVYDDRTERTYEPSIFTKQENI